MIQDSIHYLILLVTLYMHLYAIVAGGGSSSAIFIVWWRYLSAFSKDNFCDLRLQSEERNYAPLDYQIWHCLVHCHCPILHWQIFRWGKSVDDKTRLKSRSHPKMSPKHTSLTSDSVHFKGWHSIGRLILQSK